MYCLRILAFLLLVSVVTFAQTTVSSPDGSLVLTFHLDKSGIPFFSVTRHSVPVLEESRLGIRATKKDLTKGFAVKKVSPVSLSKDAYTLLTGKKTKVRTSGNTRTVELSGKEGDLIIEFRVANDGIAYRYKIPGSGTIDILSEAGSYSFTNETKAFIQPMQVSKTGWEGTNPAYEEHYIQDIPLQSVPFKNAGWVYPALFQSKGGWLLVTESGPSQQYCATRLIKDSTTRSFIIGFPDPREEMYENGLLPSLNLPGYTPWRIVAIGELSTIIESTLGTDLAGPAKKWNMDFVKPGHSSWSWIMSKDDHITYVEQKKYIDFAADMHWDYCLIDVNWDTRIGYEKIRELADYAASKKVGLILWYNSAGDWNTVKYTPRNMLLTKDSRTAEFERLHAMGIKGIKVDFFGGDGRSVMKYYHEILEDAAKANLMVNFHGATLPRGWHRTYPHLVSAEAVRGFEMITFTQEDADKEANHAAMLPFTRNAFDPMDFTPMNLHKIPTHVKRKTSSGFELALSVLFLSGIQHFAESPEGMSHMPEFVKRFLQNLPAQWDETKFIEGFPGKYVAIARRSGDLWYIAGINADSTKRNFRLDVSKFESLVQLIRDDANGKLIEDLQGSPIQTSGLVEVNPSEGFIAIVKTIKN